MKKIILFLILPLLCINNAVNAAEQDIEVKKSSDCRSGLMQKDSDGEFYCVPSWHNKNEWVDIEVSSDGVIYQGMKEKIEEKQRGWFKLVYPNKRTELALTVVDCLNNKSSIRYLAKYDKDGKFIGEVKSPSYEWNYVIPETAGETMYEIICAGPDAIDDYALEKADYPVKKTVLKKKRK